MSRRSGGFDRYSRKSNGFTDQDRPESPSLRQELFGDDNGDKNGGNSKSNNGAGSSSWRKTSVPDPVSVPIAVSNPFEALKKSKAKDRMRVPAQDREEPVRFETYGRGRGRGRGREDNRGSGRDREGGGNRENGRGKPR